MGHQRGCPPPLTSVGSAEENMVQHNLALLRTTAGNLNVTELPKLGFLSFGADKNTQSTQSVPVFINNLVKKMLDTVRDRSYTMPEIWY